MHPRFPCFKSCRPEVRWGQLPCANVVPFLDGCIEDAVSLYGVLGCVGMKPQSPCTSNASGSSWDELGLNINLMWVSVFSSVCLCMGVGVCKSETICVSWFSLSAIGVWESNLVIRIGDRCLSLMRHLHSQAGILSCTLDVNHYKKKTKMSH